MLVYCHLTCSTTYSVCNIYGAMIFCAIIFSLYCIKMLLKIVTLVYLRFVCIIIVLYYHRIIVLLLSMYAYFIVLSFAFYCYRYVLLFDMYC